MGILTIEIEISADAESDRRVAVMGVVRAAGEVASDWVAFGEPTDARLLGARTLEGMNLRVDLLARRLVPAGPMPVASAA